MREPELPRPLAGPLRGYPVESSIHGIATARRMIEAGDPTQPAMSKGSWPCGGCRRRVRNLGVFDQTINDGGSDGRLVEDVAPLGKRCVCSVDDRSLLAVAGRELALAKTDPDGAARKIRLTLWLS